MIDLNNVKCNTTKENLDKLKEFDLEKATNLNKGLEFDAYFYIENNTLRWGHKNCIGTITDKNYWNKYKEIVLVNGEFQYVETKPKNNFKDYGFEADFEGEIFKEGTILRNQKVYLATIKNGYEDLLVYFNEDGKCHQGKGYVMEEYNLKPIKKEWYENPDNFPCIVMQINCIDDIEIDCGHIIFRNIDDFNRFGGDYRHLTKEEVLALLVKE